MAIALANYACKILHRIFPLYKATVENRQRGVSVLSCGVRDQPYCRTWNVRNMKLSRIWAIPLRNSGDMSWHLIIFRYFSWQNHMFYHDLSWHMNFPDMSPLFQRGNILGSHAILGSEFHHYGESCATVHVFDQHCELTAISSSCLLKICELSVISLENSWLHGSV